MQNFINCPVRDICNIIIHVTNIVIREIVKNLLLKDKKQEFKNYFNQDLNSAIYSMYKDDNTNNEYINFKIQFLGKNINKSYQDVLSLLQSKQDDSTLYNYYKNLIHVLAAHNLDEKNFQNELEKINEKSIIRKSNGVYYTPEDVSEYIIYNCIYKLICDKINKEFFPKDVKAIRNEIKVILKSNPKIYDFIINFKVLDPTCGTGAFLIKIFECKIDLLSQYKKATNENICKIINSIHGNDIDRYSTYISKTRLLFKVLHISNSIDISTIYDYLEFNFYNLNFITSFKEFLDDYQLIIGNPPYVEKSTVDYSGTVKYGNLYADVIHNSLDLLKEKGVIGYIIPISYISTSRMANIRKYVENNTESQYVLSFADRPDCLFVGVHQKLNILLAQKKQNSNNHEVYTSDYNYWYKSEREFLFKNNELLLNKHKQDNFYPKLSNCIEETIYNKIHNNGKSIKSRQLCDSKFTLYLSKRAAFWIKSFIEEPYKSNEYSIMHYDKTYVHLINCVLNSSLYWWYWIKVSDCWHITNKELEQFYIPNITLTTAKKYQKLSRDLNDLLEKTKVKINSKQAMYEYKHRFCKNQIDLIDNELARLYDLTKEELNYIKNYKLYYRSAGAINEKEK